MHYDIKICPFCSEEIKFTAKKCRYCGEWFDGEKTINNQRSEDLSGSASDGSHSSGQYSGSRPLGDSYPSGRQPGSQHGSGSFSHTPLAGIELVRHALGDRYEVIDEIGSGGMATVYKAIQRSLGRTVALKVIHQNLVHDQEFVKRFHREAQISASLQHPNIVTIHDVGEAQGVHYMAMEYLEGTDLHRMITKTGRLGEKQSLGYLKSVARALEYVHKRGLIHRDIKSSNIFICSDIDSEQTRLDAVTERSRSDRVVLMDFGIARAASGTRLTRAGAVIGSPEYMSPEQAEAKQVDHRTDIYSLGVVLYECLTGRVPFKTDSYITTIRKVIDEPIPADGLEHLAKPLRELINALLSKKPDDRPGSAGELIIGLDLITEILSEERVKEPIPNPNKPEKRNYLSESARRNLKMKVIGVWGACFFVASVMSFSFFDGESFFSGWETWVFIPVFVMFFLPLIITILNI